jgi:hypothetical protein
LKLIIGSVLVFSLIILFLFALCPSDISVSRVIQINRPRVEVLKKINDLREWRNWNELLENPGMKNILDSHGNLTDSTYMVRDGISVRMERSGPDTIVTRWEKGNKFFDGNFNLKGPDGQTIVEWELHFHIGWYPWEKLASMFYDKQLGPVMEKSLLNLRNEMENNSPQAQ